MVVAMFSAKRLGFAGLAALGAVGLSGCFDLEQRVGLHRDGSGSYSVVVSADGVIGEGLDKDHGDVDIGDNRAVTKVTRKGDTTIETSEVKFGDLAGLKLNDERLDLHVRGKTADGETRVNFHRSFQVDHARHRHDGDDDKDGEKFGKSLLQSMFGDHTYKFAIWVPGRVEHIGAVHAGNGFVHPTVWTDATGHTIVWKMKLTDMFMADRLDFDVDFAAKGNFKDAHSLPGEAHHRRPHRHHDDDDDDDGDDDNG